MVLVTGGAGLVGSELILCLLAEGKRVRAIYNTTPIAHNHAHLELFQCSILDTEKLAEALNGISHVYNCAGFVSFDAEDNDRLYKVNVEGTANIVNLCIDLQVTRMIHVSSVAALGRSGKNELITEAFVWPGALKPGRYARSKYMGEMEVWRGISEGLNAAIINPSIILGAGNWDSGSTSMFRSAYKSFPWYTEGVKGFVDVRDVVNAMITLMHSDISGERFIISASNESFQHVFTCMAKAFHKKPPVKRATKFMAGIVWRMEAIKKRISGKKALITKETAATAFASDKYDNSKFLSFFPGFSYTPIEETIDYTCKVLQQKVNNP